jgi:hypothetical protein
MIYRPQFAYPTPPGCRDIDYVYSFDGSNVQLLNQNISGLTIPYIPLTTEQDAPFYWRAIKVNALRKTSAGVPDGYEIPNYKARFEDWAFNKLSDDFVPAVQYAFPSNPMAINTSQLTGPPTPIAEIYCPPGAVLWMFIQAPTFAGDARFAGVEFHGVKRFKECL